MLQEVENAIQHSPWEMMGKIVLRPERSQKLSGLVNRALLRKWKGQVYKFTSERRDLDSSINVGLLVGITVS